ncbi:MAG: hypothetical protein LBI34_03300 [Puniceicoccales bacterium]|jgi:hypothetical protein|nr:hypothetical protein [Puniceicoccales bacterium]
MTGVLTDLAAAGNPPVMAAGEKNVAVGVSTGVRVLRTVSTVLLVLSTVGGGTLVLLAFVVGPYVIIAPWALYAAAGAEGVSLVATIVTWTCFGGKKALENVPQPVPAPIATKNNPTADEFANTLKAVEARGTVTVEIDNPNYNVNLVSNLSNVSHPGVTIQIRLTGAAATSAGVKKVLEQAFTFGSNKANYPALGFVCDTEVAEAVQLSASLGGKTVDVRGIVFGAGGTLAPASDNPPAHIILGHKQIAAVEPVAIAAKGVTIYDVPANTASAPFAIAEKLVGTWGTATGETAKHITIVPVENASVFISLPTSKFVQIDGDVSVVVPDQQSLTHIEAASSATRYLLPASVTAFTLDGACTADTRVHVGDKVSGLTFGATALRHPVILVSQAAKSALVSVDVSNLTGGALPTFAMVDAPTTTFAPEWIAGITLSKQDAIAASQLEAVKGFSNLSTITFAAGSTLPVKLVVPAKATEIQVGANDRSKVTELDLSGCEVVPAAKNGGTSLDGDCKVAFPRLTHVSVCYGSMNSVLHSATALSNKFEKVHVAATGFSGTQKVPLKGFTDHAAAVVIPKALVDGGFLDVANLPTDNASVAGLGIFILDGTTETKVTTAAQLGIAPAMGGGGSPPPSSNPPVVKESAVDGSGVANALAGGGSYLFATSGLAIKRFATPPTDGEVLFTQAAMAGIKELPIFQGLKCFEADSSGEKTGLSLVDSTNGATGEIDLTRFSSLETVAPCPGKDVVTTSSDGARFVARTLSIPGSVQRVDLSGADVGTLVIAGTGASTLKALTLSPNTTGVKVDSTELVSGGRVLDASSLSALEQLDLSESAISGVNFTTGQAAALRGLSLRSKSGSPAITANGASVPAGDFRSFANLETLEVGRSFDANALQLPGGCKTLVLSEGATAGGGVLAVPPGVEELRVHASVAAALTGVALSKGIKSIVVVSDGGKAIDVLKDGTFTFGGPPFPVGTFKSVTVADGNTGVKSVVFAAGTAVETLDIANSAVRSVTFADQAVSSALKAFKPSSNIARVLVGAVDRIDDTKKLTLSAVDFAALETADFSKCGTGVTAVDIGSPVLASLYTGDHVTSVALPTAGTKGTIKSISLGKAVATLACGNDSIIASGVANFGTGFPLLDEVSIAEESAISGLGVDAAKVTLLHVPSTIAHISSDGTSVGSWISVAGGGSTKTLTIPLAAVLVDFAIDGDQIHTVKIANGRKVPARFDPGAAAEVVVDDVFAFSACTYLGLSGAKAGPAISVGGTAHANWEGICLAAGAELAVGADTNPNAYLFGNVCILRLAALPRSAVTLWAINAGFKEIHLLEGVALANVASNFGNVRLNGVKSSEITVFTADGVRHTFGELGLNTAVTISVDGGHGDVDFSDAGEGKVIGDFEHITSLRLGSKLTKCEHAVDATPATTTTQLFTGADATTTVDIAKMTNLARIDAGGCPSVKTLDVSGHANVNSISAGSELVSLIVKSKGDGIKRLDLVGRNDGLTVSSIALKDATAEAVDLTDAFKAAQTTIVGSATKIGEVESGLFACDAADLPKFKLPTSATAPFVYAKLQSGADQAVAGVAAGKLIFDEKELAALGTANRSLTITLPKVPQINDFSNVKVWTVGNDGILTQKDLNQLGCNVVVNIPGGGLDAGAVLQQTGAAAGGKIVTVNVATADASKIAAFDLLNGVVVQVDGKSLLDAGTHVLDARNFASLTSFRLGGAGVTEVIIPGAQVVHITSLDLETSAGTLALKSATGATITPVADFKGFSALVNVFGSAQKVGSLRSPAGGAAGGCTFTITGALTGTDKYDFSALNDTATVVLPAGENSKIEALNLGAHVQNASGTNVTNLTTFTGLTSVTGTAAQYTAISGFPSSDQLAVTVSNALTATDAAASTTLGQIFAGTTQVKSVTTAMPDSVRAGFSNLIAWDAAKLPLSAIKVNDSSAVLPDTSGFTGLTSTTVDYAALSRLSSAFFTTAPTAQSNCEVVIDGAPLANSSTPKVTLDLAANLHAAWQNFKGIHFTDTAAKALTIANGTNIPEAAYDKFVVLDASGAAITDPTARSAALLAMGITKAVAPAVASVDLGANAATVIDAIDPAVTAVCLTGNFTAGITGGATIAAANAAVTSLDISRLSGSAASLDNGFTIGADTGKSIGEVFTNVKSITLNKDQLQYLDLAKFSHLEKIIFSEDAAIAGGVLLVPPNCTVVFQSETALNSLTELIIGSAGCNVQIGNNAAYGVSKLFDNSHAAAVHNVTLAALKKVTLPADIPGAGNDASVFKLSPELETLVMADAAAKDFRGRLVFNGALKRIYSTGTTANTSIAVDGADLLIEDILAKGVEFYGAPGRLVCVKTPANARAPNLVELVSKTGSAMTVCLLDGIAGQITDLDVVDLVEAKTSSDNGSTFTAVTDNDVSKFTALNDTSKRKIAKHLIGDVTMNAADCFFGADDTLRITQASWNTVTKLTLTGNWAGKKIVLVDGNGNTIAPPDDAVLNGGKLVAIPASLTALDASGAVGITSIEIAPTADIELALASVNVGNANCKVDTITFGEHAKLGAVEVIGTGSTDLINVINHAAAKTSGGGQFKLTGCTVVTNLDFAKCGATDCDVAACTAVTHLVTTGAGFVEVTLTENTLKAVQVLISGAVDVKNADDSKSIFGNGGLLPQMVALEVLQAEKDITLADGNAAQNLVQLKFLQCNTLTVDSRGNSIDLSKCVKLAVFKAARVANDVKTITFPKDAIEANSTLRVVVVGGSGVEAFGNPGFKDIPNTVTILSATMVSASGTACNLSGLNSLAVIDLNLGADMDGAVTLPASATQAKVVGNNVASINATGAGSLALDASAANPGSVALTLESNAGVRVFVGANKTAGDAQKLASKVTTPAVACDNNDGAYGATALVTARDAAIKRATAAAIPDDGAVNDKVRAALDLA